MTIILLGKSCSGKDSICNELVKRGYEKLITYTSRPPRPDEVQDKTYHFISKEEFERLISLGFFAEWTTYNTIEGVWYYGTAIDDLECENDRVLILNPSGYEQIRQFNETVISFYIYSNLKTIKSRMAKRVKEKKGTKEEHERRLERDNIDFKCMENKVDRIIYNNDGLDTIESAVEKILSYIEEVKTNES